MRYQRKSTPDVNAVRLDPSTGDITISGVTVHAGNYLVVADDGTISEVDGSTFDTEYEAAPEPLVAEAAPEQPDQVVPVDENGNPLPQ